MRFEKVRGETDLALGLNWLRERAEIAQIFYHPAPPHGRITGTRFLAEAQIEILFVIVHDDFLRHFVSERARIFLAVYARREKKPDRASDNSENDQPDGQSLRFDPGVLRQPHLKPNPVALITFPSRMSTLFFCIPV